METRANYLLVGSFVAIFFLGLIGFVVWLAQYQFEATYNIYDIYFEGSVTGLNEGSPVRFNGVRVGDVTEIALDPEDPTRVRVRVQVRATTPVRQDTVATLDLAGLAGGQFVNLSNRSATAPPLETPEGREHAVIASAPSTLDQLFTEAPEVLSSVNLLLARAQLLLSDENIRQVSEMLANFNTVSGTLAERREDIARLVTDAAVTMRNLNEASAAMRGLVETLERDGDRLGEQAIETLAAIETTSQQLEEAITRLTGDLSETARGVNQVTGELEALIAENRPGLRDFTTDGLYEFGNLLTQARNLLAQLSRVTTEVERDPARFLFGDQQQGYDVPRQ